MYAGRGLNLYLLSISLIKIKDGWHADHASFSFGRVA